MSFYSETSPYSGLAAKTGRLISKSLPKDGNRIYSVEVEPTIEPVSIAEVKAFAKLEYDEEDSLLEGFIKSARIASEEYTGKTFISQTILMLMDFWPGTVVELPRPPLISVTKVATLDESGTETEYGSDNYYILTSSNPGKLVLKQSVSEPINTERDYGGFLIRYKAGYGSGGEDVPSYIREGIKIWTAIIQATRVMDPKNPPPEARIFLDIARTVRVMIR